MLKIGVIKCIHANDVCTGAGCLNAFNHRTDYFKDYDENTELGVFMACNGCKEERPQEPENDPGILEKLERLTREQIQVMHVGVCRIQKNGQECSRLNKILEMIEEQGISVVRGTHREQETELAEDAAKEGAEILQPTTDTVTYSDGLSEEVFGFDVPVPALDEEFDLALIRKKGTWYDHKVSVSNPVKAEQQKRKY